MSANGRLPPLPDSPERLTADDEGKALVRASVDATGATPLHAAAQCGRLSCVVALLALGVDCNKPGLVS